MKSLILFPFFCALSFQAVAFAEVSNEARDYNKEFLQTYDCVLGDNRTSLAENFTSIYELVATPSCANQQICVAKVFCVKKKSRDSLWAPEVVRTIACNANIRAPVCPQKAEDCMARLEAQIGAIQVGAKDSNTNKTKVREDLNHLEGVL